MPVSSSDVEAEPIPLQRRRPARQPDSPRRAGLGCAAALGTSCPLLPPRSPPTIVIFSKRRNAAAEPHSEQSQTLSSRLGAGCGR
ncbi:unnamed protein product [Coccothraustes coccothraustes]